MTVRKTKPVFLYRAGTQAAIYESMCDLEADVEVCKRMIGEEFEYAVDEIPLVLFGDRTGEENGDGRKPLVRINYSPAFEEFWQSVSPKKRKQEAYAAYCKAQEVLFNEGKDAEDFIVDWLEFNDGMRFTPSDSVIERLELFMEELKNGVTDGDPAATITITE